MNPDYVFVGTGVSALSCAALLAKAGKRVLMLEAHDKPGGYAHTFEVGAYRFNAQLHYVWNAEPTRTIGKILAALGLADDVTFVKLDPLGYDRMRIPGFALDVPSDYELLTKRLVALFPEHEASLRGFIATVKDTDEALDALPSGVTDLPRWMGLARHARLVQFHDATLDDVFEAFALPLEARALLALQWPDFLMPPKKLSFFAWVKLFGGYTRGAFYPKKHFHHVIDALVRVIEANGGELRFGMEVVAFRHEGERIVGVAARETKGTRLEEIRGENVICNMDPRAAAELIGFDRFSKRLRKRLTYEYSPSSFVAYCSVRGIDLRHYGFGAWNVFHADGPDLDAIFDAMSTRGDYSRVSFAMSTPTLVTDEPGDCPEGEQLLELVTVADYRLFHALKIGDPTAYRAKKQEVLDAMLDVIERAYVPHIREHLTLHMTGSPTTNERFVLAPHGNAYGSAMTPSRIFPNRLGYDSSIPGLYFCNASAGFAGFAGTMWTGARLYTHLTGDEVLG